MCTVTAISTGGGLRLVANRDEQRSRPPAAPPTAKRVGALDAVFPVDPASGGTWVAVNSAGLILALLNSNPTPRIQPPPGARSRGTIIPLLLPHDRLEEALDALGRIDLAPVPPFQLLIAGGGAYAVARWDLSHRRWSVGLRPQAGPRPGQPLFLTSSGLGDALVEGPRRKLLEELIAAGDFDAAAQDAFHRHSWPDRPHLSVHMIRDEARTVSRTTIEVDSGRALLTFDPLDGSPAHAVAIALSTAHRK